MQFTRLMRRTATLFVAFAAVVDAQQPFSVGFNFSASDSTFALSSSIPPDSMGAVGPSHIGVFLNGRWSVYDKSTGATLAGTTQNQFWANSGVTATNVAFDPRIYYDDLSSRWFAVAVDNKSLANHFMVAVSEDDDPTGNWTGFKIDSDADNGEWADFPMLGVNADTVTINANMFTIGGSSAGVSNLLVIPKGNLLSATSSSTNLNATLIEDIPHTTGTFVGAAAQPAIDLTGGSNPVRLLSDMTNGPGSVRLATLTVTPGSPALVTAGIDAPTTISVPNWFGILPVDVDQPLDAYDPVPRDPIDGGGSRFSGNVVLQQIPGRSHPTLWGVSSEWAVFGSQTNVVSWVEIDPITKTTLQSGVIDDPSLDFIFPSIAVNSAGDVVVGFSGGDANNYMGTYAAAGRTESGVTTFSEPRITQPGLGAYERNDSSGRNRWGDYSATVIDPENENLFWTFQEFVSATDQWQIQVTKISTLLGDFDADGDVDAQDIDLLAANDGGSDTSFDLNGDQTVDYSIGASGQVVSDSDELVRTILGVEYGDFNLDGYVNVADANTLTLNLGKSGGWANGDINGDGMILINDANAFSMFYGFGPPVAIVAAPEPDLLLAIGFLTPIFGARRRASIRYSASSS